MCIIVYVRVLYILGNILILKEIKFYEFSNIINVVYFISLYLKF